MKRSKNLFTIVVFELLLVFISFWLLINISCTPPPPPPPMPTPAPTPLPTPTPVPTPVAGQEWHDFDSDIHFVWVPTGCFQMGCVSEIHCEESEKPTHKVCLNGFWIGKYEITQAQWQQVMEENPSYFFEDSVGQDTLDHPVEEISWEDVQEFLQRLNERTGKEMYRLPTEAEWEYATRAGAETVFYFGDEMKKLSEYAWHSDNSEQKPHPVGMLQPNNWGLYDVYGNVWEWCQDWFDSEYYSESPSTNPSGPSSGDYRILRGGSWFYDPLYCRSAYRKWATPGYKYIDIGFRVAVSSEMQQ